ncbi:MAG: tetratricopeptide repeat protein, partial [Pseudomonadota bacterium]
MHPLLRHSAAALSLVLAAAVHADELQDIARIMRQGQLPQALQRIDKFLAGKPRDAQGRFLKGLVLTEMNRPSEAIQVFTKLSEDYPELPEPYNNLAVLYASQGQYEKARVALESSIRTHPSYATAHENLGDIYAKLASQAYDKALQLDSSNTAAKTKLAMIGEMIGGGARTARAPVRAEPVKPTETRTGKAPDAGKAIAAASAKPKAAEPKSAEAPAKSGGGRGNDSDEVINTVHAWANAWAKKDVAGYLAFYAKEFKTPKGEARGDWENSRK